MVVSRGNLGEERDMINQDISDSAAIGELDARRTRVSQPGHVVYGPYETITQGVYQVEFTLALVDAQEGDGECAAIDVCSESGQRSIAAKPIRVSDLSTEARTFSLLFVLRRNTTIEYRVYSHGTTSLLVASEPVITRVSGVLDEEPRPGLAPEMFDLEKFGHDTRRILACLRPCALKDYRKARLGNPGDGGYVCVDDFEGIDTAFSFGINDDISWDLAAAERGLRIYQFDHTVSDPAPTDTRMVFEPKRIDAHSGPNSQSLGDLIQAHDRGFHRPNIVLKMDIEGGEWPVIEATSLTQLSRIAWIVCEMHYFQGLAEPGYRQLIDRCLSKLSQGFALVHVHANVTGGISSLGNVIMPNVIEVALANRAVYRLDETDEIFPGELDRSCGAGEPDFYLGSFRF